MKDLIIVIGNGFDLAHDVKTDYKTFIQLMLERSINSSPNLENNSSEENFPFKQHFINALNFKGLSDKTYDFVKRDITGSIIPYKSELPLLLTKFFLLEKNWGHSNLIFKNQLFSTFFKNQNKIWNNIEEVYYHELLSILDIDKISRKDYRGIKKNEILRSRVLEFNKEFEEIKTQLKEYLSKIETTKKPDIESFFERLTLNYKDHYILNFNYTKTAEYYFEKSKINYIHGSVDSDIIFGFGNDQDFYYPILKELDIDELLENFKTYKYSEFENYSELLNKLVYSEKQFDVVVIGHSLGSTDKTLLKEIFENEFCKKIEILKRGDLPERKRKREWKKIQMAAARIFDNDIDVRRKIKSLKISKSFPG